MNIGTKKIIVQEWQRVYDEQGKNPTEEWVTLHEVTSPGVSIIGGCLRSLADAFDPPKDSRY